MLSISGYLAYLVIWKMLWKKTFYALLAKKSICGQFPGICLQNEYRFDECRVLLQYTIKCTEFWTWGLVNTYPVPWLCSGTSPRISYLYGGSVVTIQESNDPYGVLHLEPDHVEVAETYQDVNISVKRTGQYHTVLVAALLFQQGYSV